MDDLETKINKINQSAERINAATQRFTEITKKVAQVRADALKGSFLGSKVYRLLDTSMTVIAPVVVGMYTGFNHAHGMDIDIPIEVMVGLAVTSAGWGYVGERERRKKVQAYIKEQTETTTDEGKIREYLDAKVGAMSTYEKNHLLLQRSPVTFDPLTKKIDASDYLLRNYILCDNAGNEKGKTDVIKEAILLGKKSRPKD